MNAYVISSVSTIAGFLSVDEVTVEKIEDKLKNSAHLNEVNEVKKRNDSETDKNAFILYFLPLLELSRAELLRNMNALLKRKKFLMQELH